MIPGTHGRVTGEEIPRSCLLMRQWHESASVTHAHTHTLTTRVKNNLNESKMCLEHEEVFHGSLE